jgi:hypothetical protein
MKLLIMQVSPTSGLVIPLWSKYTPQHPVLTLSLCTSLNVRYQVSHPNRTTGKIIILYILIFMFLVVKKLEYGYEYLKIFKDVDMAYLKLNSA